MRNIIYNALKLFDPILNNINKNRLRVLAYHDIVDPDNLEAQVIHLKSKYNLINISTLKEHLFNNRGLPSNSVLITLDDGDRSVFTKALPVFKKHHIPSCLFVVTELINKNKDFWWNTIIKNEKKNGLSQKEIIRVLNEAKSVSNERRLNLLKKYPTTYQQQLKTEELIELKKNGVYIGNHSHTHPMFDKLNRKELVDELSQVHAFFKSYKIGDSEVFAYPNGNFSESSEHLLHENNIKVAFLFDHKINEKHINPLRISRLVVNDITPLWKFKLILSGWHGKILPLTRVVGKLKKTV
ncbi:polysaccharide deacetylase family protein [Salinimicrobium terrae]|uniref:polysaccharide deacetylase family protein n=1 Tax=Salinimicrobium terrae TaxID=470866 RepID=UPI000401140F|nr:polysaccharide deacetylase family protein [Salinimicrobium terrae]